MLLADLGWSDVLSRPRLKGGRRRPGLRPAGVRAPASPSRRSRAASPFTTPAGRPRHALTPSGWG